LALIARQLWERESELVVVALRPSILTEVATQAQVPVIERPDLTPPEVEEILTPYSGTVTVIVDDVERLKNAPIEHALSGISHRARFIVSADVESTSTLFGGPFVEAKRARRAMVLLPT